MKTKIFLAVLLIFIIPTKNIFSFFYSCYELKKVREYTSIIKKVVPRKVPITKKSASVNFINFEAIVNKNKIDITWKTSSENNTNYFTIERSRKGRKWKSILTSNGSRNSEQIIEYYETDYNPLHGTIYYRLRHTTIEGNNTYSNIVKVQYLNKKQKKLKAYLAIENMREIEMKNIFNSETLVVIRDMIGNEYYSKLIINMKDEKLIASPIDIDIPKGIYLITATSEDIFQGKKIIIR